jgi:hypothetical protein
MRKILFLLALFPACVPGQITTLTGTTVLTKSNVIGTTPTAPTPTFSPATPYTGGNVTVTIADYSPGATINYCTSNSGACSSGWSTYSTGISFTNTGPTNICAYASQTGYTNSSTACWAGTYSSGGSYTGQWCSFGGTGSSLVCTGSLTVSTNDVIVIYSNGGQTGLTLNSCSLSAGSASVSWTVDTALTKTENIFNNTSGWCRGNVTSGGTATPQAVWSSSNAGSTLVAAAFSGTTNALDGSTSINNASGSTSSNGVTPGTITTATNNDVLVGGTLDVAGTAATISAGTTSVTFTKIGCVTDGTFVQLCMEWGSQPTAGAGTTAAWTYGTSHANLTGIEAIK